ncbi:zinc-binding protein A33-like [Protopterus annectens]|uniref:zinc-binding protein A33-like n=1 Tax=Protopterus annectens TaxID=7888 RepID=UPI001CFBFCB0|nr:zinc-binding protein A33-like [Protopterus annectens]
MEENLKNIQQESDSTQSVINDIETKLKQQDPISLLMELKSLSQKADSKIETEVQCKPLVNTQDHGDSMIRDLLQYNVWTEMKTVLSPALPFLTLDSNTAHHSLILCENLTSMQISDSKQAVPDNPARFRRRVAVLGAQGFESGKHYWEVKLGLNKKDWDVGIATKSINRKEQTSTSPWTGYWALGLRNGSGYQALEPTPKELCLSECLQKLGVYLDYEGGRVSFYNADNLSHIYTFTTTFTEKVYPYFCLQNEERGSHTEPGKSFHQKLKYTFKSKHKMKQKINHPTPVLKTSRLMNTIFFL